MLAPARARRLRAQTNCGHPEAKTTCGLVAYVGDEPAGWCRVQPRSDFVRLGQTPWKGRLEDPRDPAVWAAACFVVRSGYRRRRITYHLAQAAVEFARERGASALEGYGMITKPGQEITWGELHVGSRSAFAAAGLTEVGRPSQRRVVMRIEF